MNPFKPNDPERALRYFEDKMMFSTGPVELARALRHHENVNVVDVRTSRDFQQEHIPGAHSLPRDRWSSLEGLAKDKLNVVVCYSQVCHLAATAAVQFASHGYSVMELEGGFRSWKEHHLPVEHGHIPSQQQTTTTQPSPAISGSSDGREQSAAASQRH